MKRKFLSATKIGDLELCNIYEYFDGPKLFSIKNQNDEKFICFWVDDEVEHTKWYIFNTTDNLLNEFENSSISMRDIFLAKTKKYGYFEMLIGIASGELIKISKKSYGDLDIEGDLPEPDIYIEENFAGLTEEIMGELYTFNQEQDKESIFDIMATHSLKIFKSKTSSKKAVSAVGVGVIMESIDSLYKLFCQHYLDNDKIKEFIEPIDASYGSFDLSFRAKYMEKFEPALAMINELIPSRKDLSNALKTNNFDIDIFLELLNSVKFNRNNFTISRIVDGAHLLTIRPEDAEYYIPVLSKSAITHLSSLDIPQADDLAKVIFLVKLISKGIKPKPEHFDFDKKHKDGEKDTRHIKYYSQAAKILGLIDAYEQLTPLGHQTCNVTNIMNDDEDKKKYILLARAFQTSKVGWAWTKWSNANNITEITSDTSKVFLRECCDQLSETTVTRRSSTIKTWLDFLKPHYID